MVTFVSAILIDWRRENGRLIKNVYPSTQADSPKKILLTLHTSFSCNIQHPSRIFFRAQPDKITGVSLDRHSHTSRLLIKSAAQNDRASRAWNRRPRQ